MSTNNEPSTFGEFTAKYNSTSELWKNCNRPDWMLWVLYEHHYRNAEKLEKFIEWLTGQVEIFDENFKEELLRGHFNYNGCVKQFEEDMKSEKINDSEARRRRFMCTWNTAFNAIGFVLEHKTEKAEFNHHVDPILAKDVGIEMPASNFNEVEYRRSVFREQADKLREIIGNPFEFAGVNDFY
jgi:hypothetical protein